MNEDYEDLTPYIGKGWHQHVAPVVRLCNEHGIKIQQIKEKLGGLRFYIYGAPQEVHDAIDAAEVLCSKTCEDCGTMNDVKTCTSLRNPYWIVTLCESCRDAMDKEKL